MIRVCLLQAHANAQKGTAELDCDDQGIINKHYDASLLIERDIGEI